MTYGYKNNGLYKQEISVSGSGAGGLSVIMIFAVLCLTVFSALTLLSSKSEFNSALIYTDSVKNYYKADYEASYFTAALMSAKNLNEIQLIADHYGASAETVTDTGGGTYIYIAYDTEIDKNQNLAVRLTVTPRISEGVIINILEWLPVYTEEWSSDIGLNLLKFK